MGFSLHGTYDVCCKEKMGVFIAFCIADCNNNSMQHYGAVAIRCI